MVRHHALVDGNKRLGWAAAAIFYDLNGFDLDPPSVDEAVDLVVAVAAGHLELGKLRPGPGRVGAPAQVRPQTACVAAALTRCSPAVHGRSTWSSGSSAE